MSVRSRQRPAPRNGFTLIEVLVVVVIIAVLTGVAVLSVGDGGLQRKLDREARRLAAVIRLASEEAVLQSRELGLRVERDGYRFYRLDDSGSWTPVQGVRALERHELPDELAMTVRVEGLEAELADGDDERDTPQVLVLSSGEMTPFEIRLRARGSDRTVTIRGELVGRVKTDLEGRG